MIAYATLPRRNILELRLMVLLMVSLLGPILLASGPIFQAARAEASLLALATTHPHAHVAVVVQQQAQANVAQIVVQLGGVISKELPIINAVAAEVPARALQQLARSPGVAWVSLDAPVVEHSTTTPCNNCVNPAHIRNTYPKAVGVDQVWQNKPQINGRGITVAVVDTGLNNMVDLQDSAGQSRIKAEVKYAKEGATARDLYGHGTHVAGIIGGNGAASNGAVVGMAPDVNLVNVRVSNSKGGSTTSDVVAGLQWVYNNRERYNIRVVNLSLNSTTAESYHTSPLAAAVEILWFNKVVVVVAGGNSTDGIIYPPANDPFVISVGAVDDRGTAQRSDDRVAAFSAQGITSEGFRKPELVAPGVNITSLMCKNCELYKARPDRIATGFTGAQHYFRLSGTSMSAAVVSGAVALLLQQEPELTPDQVKQRLIDTGTNSLAGPVYLDVAAALSSNSQTSANIGTPGSKLLWSGDSPAAWNSVNWHSVNWHSVNWHSVNWHSVNWHSVNWATVYWED